MSGEARQVAAHEGAHGDDLVVRIGQLTRMLRESMRELGLDKEVEKAAEAIPDARARLNYVASMTEQAAEDACISVRTDGLSVDIDGDYTETLARIAADTNGIGVFGLAFYENNTDKLRVATMAGVVPTTESIASGDYPVSRPLYFYIKAAHIDVIPGVKDFAEFFVSDDMAGPDGPLAEYGLVSDPDLLDVQEAVMNEVLLAK